MGNTFEYLLLKGREEEVAVFIRFPGNSVSICASVRKLYLGIVLAGMSLQVLNY